MTDYTHAPTHPHKGSVVLRTGPALRPRARGRRAAEVHVVMLVVADPGGLRGEADAAQVASTARREERRLQFRREDHNVDGKPAAPRGSLQAVQVRRHRLEVDLQASRAPVLVEFHIVTEAAVCVSRQLRWAPGPIPHWHHEVDG